jgi:hypothetical protein
MFVDGMITFSDYKTCFSKQAKNLLILKSFLSKMFIVRLSENDCVIFIYVKMIV